MIKVLRYGGVGLMLIISSITSLTQDLHFSQFTNSPLLTNPANAGFIPDGDFRIGANYRNQWSSVTAFPYKTMSVFGDLQVMPDPDANGWIGLGDHPSGCGGCQRADLHQGLRGGRLSPNAGGG